MNRAIVSVVSLGVLGLGLVGCETKAGTGALIGSAAGAGIGAIIGNNSGGHTATGALIGAGVGAGGGALIGNEMDKKDREAERRRDREDYERRVYGNQSSRYESRAQVVTKQEVIDWSRRGDSDEVIIDRIERSGSVINLSSRDENQLRDAGVGEEVIRAMRDTTRR